MSEHRKATRKKLMAFTPVYDADQRVLLGYVRNLSLLGVMVVGEKIVEINQVKMLKIEFPNKQLDLISTHITIPAQVAWCKQDKNLGYFDTGFEFTQVTPEQTKVFQVIMERYQFRQDMPNY